MNYRNLTESIVKKALKAGADEAETYLEHKREFELWIRKGNVSSVKQATSKGVGLTVFKDMKLGFSATSDLSDESLDQFAKRTVQLALVANPKAWNRLPDARKGKTRDLDLYDPSTGEIPNEKKIEMAKELERTALAYDDRIIQTRGTQFRDSEEEIFITNSKGISRALKSTKIELGTIVIARSGNDRKIGYFFSVKRHFQDLDSIENIAKKAGKTAIERLGAKPILTQKVPVVFDRRCAYYFWIGILLAMNGDKVYKKNTYLAESLDKSITSELITIIDNPTIPRHVCSVPFDGEGNITRKNVLIDKGVLRLFIYDTLTARKAGVKVNPLTQRSGYRSRPSAFHLNAIVQNGATDREKIIAEIKNGYLATFTSSPPDITTGNYSSGSSGFWIKDGEIAFPVAGVTLGGNIRDIMKNIEAVANDMDKDAEGSFQHANSPSFKISEMTVGGKK